MSLTTNGSASYRIAVPVSGQTFTLASQSTSVVGYYFYGNSSITSSGNGCRNTCNGTLYNNYSVIGIVGGPNGNRLGLNYGFSSVLGNVSGVIVFKR